MKRILRTMLLFFLFAGMLFASSNVVGEQTKEDADALKKHVYALNKPNLKSKKWLERAGACERIGILAVQEYADDIVPLLTDPIALVRISAIRGVGMCKNPKYIDAIADILVATGNTLEDRLTAVNCGFALGQIDPEKGAEVVMTKYGEKKTAEYAVAMALGYIGGVKASDSLKEFLLIKDPHVLGAAYRSAGRLATPLDHKLIAKTLVDSKAPLHLKMDMLFAVRSRKDAAAKPYLLKTLESKETLVSNGAAWTLAEIGLTKQEALSLASSAEKGSATLKMSAAKCLVLGGAKEAPEAAGPFLKINNEIVRAAACNILIQYPQLKMKQDLNKAFNSDRSRYVKWAAAMALGALKDDATANELADFAKNSKDVANMARAAEALAIARQSSTISKLAEIVKNSEDNDIVLLAGMAMADINRNEGAQNLISLLTDGDMKVRIRGIKALRFFPTANVVTALIGQFDRNIEKAKPGQNEEYKKEILSSLERISGHRYRPESGIWNEWWTLYQTKAKGKSIAEANKAAKKNEQRRNHDESIKSFGGSGDGEESVELGLYWQMRHQDPVGNVSSMYYSKNCTGGSPCIPPARAEYDAGMTGMALLCMSSGGYTNVFGKYMDVYERALDYMITMQVGSGCIREKGTDEQAYESGGQQVVSYENGLVYEQAIAVVALCETFAMTEDERLKIPCQLAIDWVQSHQNYPLGWRYTSIPEDTDSSVSGWYVLALKTARMYGFRVFEKGFEGALHWYDKVTQPYSEYETLDLGSDYGDNFKQNIYEKKGTGYDDNQPLPSMTAISLITRRFIGFKRTHPLLRAQANYLTDWKVAFDQATGARNFNFAFYFIYYTSMANFQMGSTYWSDWNKQLVPKVREMQVLDASKCGYGSWNPGGALEGYDGGRVLCTQFMILSLEIYYRYQPLLDENIIVID
ncbi:MAG: HEAT repeat domain-containing protein [Candidatus Brocadiia bacterium]